MSTINDVIESLENETKYIMVDGKPVSLKTVIDRILNKDEEEKKRRLSKG